MTFSVGPRDCGRHAWLEWVSAIGHIGRRLPWEGWVTLGLAAVGLGMLSATWPSFLLLMVLWGCAARRPIHAWVDRARQATVLPSVEALELARKAWPKWAGWKASVAVAIIALCVEVLSRVFATPIPLAVGQALLLGLWVPWVFRPWGPVGFVGSLVAEGCPPLQAHRLQVRAVLQNKVSLGCLTLGWFALLIALFQAPWATPVAWGAWAVMTRVAFLDIFKGGWSMARLTQPVASPSAQVARARC